MASRKKRQTYVEELVDALVNMGVTGQFSGELTATPFRKETGEDTNFNIGGNAEIDYKNDAVDLNAYYDYGKNSMFNDEQNTLGGSVTAKLPFADLTVGGSRTQPNNSFYHDPSSTKFNAGVDVPVLGGVFSLKRVIDHFNDQKNRQDRASFNRTGVFSGNDVVDLYGKRNTRPSEKPENIIGLKYTLPF